MVSDPSVADDVVQETWMTALERPPKGEVGSSSVKAWLARVVRNSALQRFRGESRRGDREYLEVRDSSLEATSSEELVDQIDGQRQLVQEVLALGEPMRSTVILRYFKDLSSAEIAREQGIPAATVRSRLSRAMEELRTRMDARYDGNRSAWSLALAGSIGLKPQLAPPPQTVPPGTTPPLLTGHTILEGALAMKIGTGLALALGIAALTVAGIAALDADEPATMIEAANRFAEPELPTDPADLAMPVVESDRERLAVELEPVERAVEPKAAPATSSVPAATEMPVFAPASLVARFTDSSGNPVGDVEWSLHLLDKHRSEVAQVTRSGTDGYARIELPMIRDKSSVALVHSLRGYATGVSQTTARSGREVNVGTIELAYSVSISGRVVDEQGRPIEGARVFAMPADQGGKDEGELQRIGPGVSSELGALSRLAPSLSRADGTFELSAPIAERVRVYAKAEGTRYCWTAPMELLAGTPILGVVLELSKLQDTDHIAGIVLDAEGQPFPHALITFNFADTNIVMSSGVDADENGEFDLVLHRIVPHSLRVEGDEQHPGIATAASVEPGTLDLVLQLAAKGGITLYVKDEAGEPLDEFSLQTQIFFENGSSSSRISTFQPEQGRVELPVPSDSFGFEVTRRGYVTETLGPFEAGTYPSELFCTLVKTPGVRGRVVDNGEPLAGVAVRLLVMAPKGARYMVNGFPSRLGWGIADEGTTDENGEFLLSAAADGTYIVHAEPSAGTGLAAVESEPFRVFVAEAFEGLVLDPEPGGTLVVTVRRAAGEDLAGIIVGITDAGRDSRTVRTDESGTVRFTGLRPGKWLVKECEEELSPSRGSSSSTGVNIGYEVPFNCEVGSELVTDFELVL